MNQNRPMHPTELACLFMQRADLKGNEVEPYAQTYNWLQAILSGDFVVIEKKEYETLLNAAQKAPDAPEGEGVVPAALDALPENEAPEASEGVSADADIPVLPVEDLSTA